MRSDQLEALMNGKSQYVIRNRNGTLDTMFCGDTKMVAGIASASAWGVGGVDEVTRVPTITDLDLQSDKLSIGLVYATSLN